VSIPGGHTNDGLDQRGAARRRLLLTLVATGGAFAGASALPRKWTAPLVDSVVVPLHAQASEVVLLGPFSTGATAGIQAAVPIGTIIVGNVSFNAAWNLDSDGYSICGNGLIGFSVPFTIDDTGDRTGNQLEDYIHPTPLSGQTFQIVKQVVALDGGTPEINFIAMHGSQTVPATAPQTIAACGINSTTVVQMSSPYPDPKA